MASRDGGEAMGFHVVIDKDDLREGVQLTVDVNWSLEDATLMIKGAVCKTVRCHLFFVQRRTGAGAGNLELQNDKQGVDAIDFQKLLASQACRFGRCQWPVAVQPASAQTRAFAREVLHKIGRHAVVARPDDLGDCGAGPRAGELAEEQAATNEGSVQSHHVGHQAAVPPVQDAVHGADSRVQDSAAGFEPEADGEDVDETHIFQYRQ